MSELIGLRQLMLEAPEGQLDRSVLPLIEKWDDPPKAIQILEVLDECIHYSLASEFVVSTLQTMLDVTLIHEGITLDHIVAQAVWRY